MAIEKITVPDIGGAENVDVIEVSVAVGDEVAVDDALIVVESDKASMDIPSPAAGKIVAMSVKEGDKVNEGDLILELETGAEEAPAAEQAAPATAAPAASAAVAELPVSVPDLGGADSVDLIEMCVAVGDEVAEGDSLIVLESDKASMDIPAPAAGKVLSISVKEGDKLSQGDAILVLASGDAAPAEAAAPAAPEAAAPAPAASAELAVDVPDIGGSENVDVIEICVAEGDEVNEGDSLIVLESDKASMDIPSPASGKVLSLHIKEGDKVSQGSAILVMQAEGQAPAATPAPVTSGASPAPQLAHVSPEPVKHDRTVEASPKEIQSSGSEVYAGPASRKLAREMGVDLTLVQGTGPRGRISKDDIKAYVKLALQSKASGPAVAIGSGIPTPPEVDYSQFGEIELQKMSKIKQLTAEAMTRNWLNIPRVTQFDDADITDVEAFRKGMKAEAEKAGVKLTPMPFIIKAAAAALQAEPSFNVAMHNDGEHIIQKKFIHIAIAVDTPRGLMVPVIRDVDQKGVYQIAQELIELAGKARDGKLKPNEMQGGCFTISSLGPIGGTGFTPMVSTTEAGILGVSKAAMKPIWDGKEFQPRLMLPLSLSYDHRAVNGSDAGRFLTYLSAVLGDVRRLLL
ncbi:pyruvate dehydrogenase complex dihydrolipoyllysine-residue acetyltransferase [Agaribacterium sp. ZY112]|uniref:pyruvate dehydrogenase complex dihydrolipoyllysine-residue acetyltransferase n=1 Tax=Agaribacterium sp. ZY112 TaxID=3233574 RepID=UPI0035262459